jgi:hypothetical protein
VQLVLPNRAASSRTGRVYAVRFGSDAFGTARGNGSISPGGDMKTRIKASKREKDLEREVAMWYLTAKSHIDQLYHQANRMSQRLKNPKCILNKFITQDEVHSLYCALEIATCRLADFVPIVGPPLPDPLAILDRK